MPDVTPQQTRKLGSHALTRDGVDVVIPALKDMACWNFALTGTEIGMFHPDSTQAIYEGANGIFNLNNFVVPPVCNGLLPTATAGTYPNCAAEIGIINLNVANAIAGNVIAQNAIQLAMLKILVIRNGLVPGVADDRYRIHMKSTTWFGWDHFSFSFRAVQPGRPRIYVQTVTGKPLSHACTTIWDEHLLEVWVNVQELHQTQINFINMVTDYGDLCIDCGEAHGFFWSNPLNAWHRCTTCRGVYCPTHEIF